MSTKTVPPPTPLRFSLQLDRTYTEMTLAKAEGNRARAELYDLLKKVLENYHQHKNNKDSLADNTLSVDIYEVSQRFSSDHLKAAFKQPANNGTAQQHQLLDGALLKTVVQVMGQKAIFGQNAAVDTEKYVFEIFDEYAQDYVTLCHLESPVPNGARLRIKLNAIQDVFSYEESSDHHHQVVDLTTNKNKTATVVDHSKNSKPKKKVEEEKTEKGTELKVSSPQQQQSQTKSVYHTAKSTKFPSSSFSNNCLALDSSVTQKKKTALGKGKKGNKKRNKRRGNNNNNQQQLQQYSSNVACYQKPSLPPLTRAQVHMFKDIFKALESEAVLEEIERQAGLLLAKLADIEVEGSDKKKKSADKKGTVSKNQQQQQQQHLFQHLIEHLWKCVVDQVASLPTSATDRAVAPAPGYLGAQCQHLYHLVVCVHYLDALARANSYLEAAAIFELFSFVHGKVLTPYFRLEDYFTGYKEEMKEEEKDDEEEDKNEEDIENHQEGDNGLLKNSQSQEFPSVHCVCLCGVCGLTTGALIAARAAFCDKQVVLVVTQDFEDFEGDDKEEKEEEEDVVVLVATEEDKSPELGDDQ